MTGGEDSMVCCWEAHSDEDERKTKAGKVSPAPDEPDPTNLDSCLKAREMFQ